MSTFILWNVILFALRAVAGIIRLANGWKAKDTPGSMAFRVLMNAALAVWGIYLLAKAAA
jgi:hypothetical protein